MSAICEICGKEFKNTQGLRGHKTFVHRLTSFRGKSDTPLATEQLREVSQQVKLASSNTEVHNLSRQVAQLNEQVKKHADWLTPNPIALLFGNNSYNRPAFLLDLDRLEAQVRDHQGAINWVRKEFNLVKKGGKV